MSIAPVKSFLECDDVLGVILQYCTSGKDMRSWQLVCSRWHRVYENCEVNLELLHTVGEHEEVSLLLVDYRQPLHEERHQRLTTAVQRLHQHHKAQWDIQLNRGREIQEVTRQGIQHCSPSLQRFRREYIKNVDKETVNEIHSIYFPSILLVDLSEALCHIFGYPMCWNAAREHIWSEKLWKMLRPQDMTLMEMFDLHWELDPYFKDKTCFNYANIEKEISPTAAVMFLFVECCYQASHYAQQHRKEFSENITVASRTKELEKETTMIWLFLNGVVDLPNRRKSLQRECAQFVASLSIVETDSRVNVEGKEFEERTAIEVIYSKRIEDIQRRYAKIQIQLDAFGLTEEKERVKISRPETAAFNGILTLEKKEKDKMKSVKRRAEAAAKMDVKLDQGTLLCLLKGTRRI